MTTPPSCPLLALPPELRNNIYTHTLATDLSEFGETATLPALLKTNPQLDTEYSPIFYLSPELKIEEYHSLTDAWTEIRELKAKRQILERSAFLDLYDFWSLASARRYCQRVGYGREGSVRRGIVTVVTTAGFRRWQWSIERS